MTYATITGPACRATVYLQGAHLTEWCPADQQPVLFLSEHQSITRGKAIRGGVPIIFPWFGARTANQYSSRVDGPSHGFARTAEWQVVETKLSGDDVELTLTLGPDDTSRELGFDAFLLTYKLILGANIGLHLSVRNQSTEPIKFEEALHSYFSVGDVRQIKILGLIDTDYFDKTDGFKRKRQTEHALTLTGETDRPYVGTNSTVEIVDATLQRRIIVSKENSQTTVIWNPWTDLTAKLADMNPDDWLSMVCVETANALENAVTLAPGEEHRMAVAISVENLAIAHH
ncbi:MAG: D-hexose-6-phosphate mutarotase [Candidatus Obscuribacterales bacterium]|nr:D-hexose-6-phosphate mutarotase [Candidatus Obscuribacterales bacterium]